MADFDQAYEKTMKHEGGYANNPADRGGETYRGIARKFWPGWPGWPLVDKAKQKPNFPRRLSDDAELQKLVKAFYFANFWPHYVAEIKEQAVAEWLFDKSVNMGLVQAIKLIQRAAEVADDGRFGPRTAIAINNADPVDLVEKCREQARIFYRGLVEKNPGQAQFLKGWLARA